MIKKTDRETARTQLASFIKVKRPGNWAVSTELLRSSMDEYGLTPEDVGTTEAELRQFFLADCRWHLETDLENWRQTNSYGSPERVFATGVIENLRKGELKPEEFGITPEELQAIKDCAGLD